MAVFDNISAIAVKKGLSIKEIEFRAGLGNGTIGKWKNTNPTLKSLEKVAEVLNVKISTLLKE